MTRVAWNKIVWTDEMVEFLMECWESMTNKELADMLGLRVTSVRTKRYEMGLLKMEMEYWTDEQVAFLRENFMLMGDTEMAEVFEAKWPKGKPWRHSHIEKKRSYLKLKRSDVMIARIFERNKASGRLAVSNKKRWAATGISGEGTVRYWRLSSGRPFPMVKVNGVWKHWNRVAWEDTHGPVPKGMNVVFVNGDNTDLRVENLELLTDGELSARTASVCSTALSDNYVVGMMKLPKVMKECLKAMPELIELKKNLLKTKRIIKDERERVGNERH